MARLRPWVAGSISGNRARKVDYPLAASQTFNPGDFVKDNGSQAAAIVADTDADTFLGLANEHGDDPIRAGYVNITIISSDVIFAMEGDNAPTAADLLGEYDVDIDGDNIFYVNGAGVGTAAVQVVGIDVGRSLYFVRFLDARISYKA
jgi:hypothetical protein